MEIWTRHGERERERESREISGRIAPTALQRQVLECRGFLFGSGEWGLGAGEKNRSLCLLEDIRNTPD
jgi:hypothetical protein